MEIIGRIEDIRERYASIRATGSYAESVQEYESWGERVLEPWVQANDGFTVGMVGGKPSDFGIQAMQFLPPGSDPLGGGMSPDAVMRAYNDGANLSSQSDEMGRFWNAASFKFQNLTMQSMGFSWGGSINDITVRGGPTAPQEIREWTAAAYGFLSSFASAHATEYQQKADEFGISIEGLSYRERFFDLDAEYGNDLSTGQPKSNAERIFFAIASPAEIAAFKEKMEPFQGPIDALYAAKADDVARKLQYNKDMLQYNKDLKAVSDRIDSAFSSLGMDKITLSQLRFRQAEDGSIQVSGHPQAEEIGAAINADAELAGLIAFAFGFSGRGTTA